MHCETLKFSIKSLNERAKTESIADRYFIDHGCKHDRGSDGESEILPKSL